EGGWAWRGLGGRGGDRGETRRALGLAGRGVALARLAGDAQLEARFLDGVGLTKNFLGDPAGASEALTRAVALARRLGDPQTENEALNKLGWSASLLGEYQRAIDTYTQAIAIAPRGGERAAAAGTGSPRPGPPSASRSPTRASGISGRRSTRMDGPSTSGGLWATSAARSSLSRTPASCTGRSASRGARSSSIARLSRSPAPSPTAVARLCA